MKLFIALLVLIVAAIAAPLLFRSSGGGEAARPVEGLPWQIEALPDGSSRVFGLTMGSSTLGEARARLGTDMQVAIIAAAEEPGSLEAYYDSVTTGSVTGKMILTAEVATDTVERMRQRAIKTRYMESSSRKATLHPDDLQLAYAAPIRAIAFIPSINLDEQTVLGRFGPPGERVRSSEHTEHYLYPEKGLDLALDSEGKELLQYVAPRQFARLRDPLMAKGIRPGRPQ